MKIVINENTANALNVPSNIEYGTAEFTAFKNQLLDLYGYDPDQLTNEKFKEDVLIDDEYEDAVYLSSKQGTKGADQLPDVIVVNDNIADEMHIPATVTDMDGVKAFANQLLPLYGYDVANLKASISTRIDDDGEEVTVYNLNTAAGTKGMDWAA